MGNLPETIQPAGEEKAGPVRVLVVEDEEHYAMLISRILTESDQGDFVAVTAGSLEEALAELEEDSFDTIILDLNLPDSAGGGTVERIRESDPAVPVIVLTGIQDESIVGEAMLKGADNYLFKDMAVVHLLPRTVLRASEQARAVTALRQSEERFRTLFEESPDAVFVEDQQGNVLDVNGAACRLHGMAREELVGKNVLELVPPGRKEETARKFPDWGTGKLIALDTYSYTRDGRAVPVEIRGSPIMFDGRPAVLLQVRDVTARKMAEDVLKRRESQLHEAQRLARMGNWEWDILHNTSTWSGEVCDIFGVSPEMLHREAGQAFLDCVHPEDRERVTAVMEKAVAEQGAFETEYRIVRPDGEVRYVHARGNVVADDSGRAARMVGVTQDVTDRRRSEAAIRDSERKFRELVENMSSGVVVYGPVDSGNDFVIKAFNRAAETIENVSRRDVIGQRATRAFPGVEAMGLLEVFRRVWREGGSERFPAVFYSDDRISGWRENFVYRLPSGDVVAVYDDVTERRQAVEALRESEERFRGIFEYSPVGIELFDADGRRMHCNAALMKMFGMEGRDVIPAFNILRDQNTTPTMRRDLQEGRLVRQIRWIDFDGVREEGLFATTRRGKILVSCTFGPLGTDIPPRGYVSAIEDVTDHWRAEQEVRSFSRRLLSVREEEKKAVSGALHHEVGSMAVGMSARLDAIEEQCREQCPAETIESIRQGKAMLAESIGRLKNLAIEIRPPDLDILGLRAALKELASQVMRHAPLDVRLGVRGECGQLGTDWATVTFRVVQESLTNIVNGVST